jgi:hypothetical protein
MTACHRSPSAAHVTKTRQMIAAVGHSRRAKRFCKIASVRKIFPAFSSFQQCSSGGEQQAVEPVDEGEFASVEGKDDPSSFPGMPKKNDKGYAGDAAQPRRNGHGYFDAFPSNRKVGFGYGD